MSAVISKKTRLSEKLFEQWYDDPDQFDRDIWPEAPPEVWQTKASGLLVRNDSVAIRSGHGVGKSAWLARRIIWWGMTRYPWKVGCTAPSSSTMFDALWSELAKWHSKMPEALKAQFEWKADRFDWLKAPAISYAVAKTARRETPEALAGLHSENMLFVIDEACFDDQTEILTDCGWKFFSDLDRTEKVLTKDPETGIADYSMPTKWHQYDHDGEMYYLKQRGADFCITPNHRVCYQTLSSKKWRFDEVQKAQYTMGMSRSFTWPRKVINDHVIPEARFQRKLFPAKTIDMLAWAEFLGWYFSEGCIQYTKERPYSVDIAQNDYVVLDEIIGTLARCGIAAKRYGFHVRANSRQIAEEISSYGRGFAGKRVPRYILDADKRVIDAFLKSYLRGDGHKKGNRDIYYTSSKGLADDLQELILKSGGVSSVTKRSPKGKTNLIHDHYATSSCDGYVVCRYAEHDLIKVERPDFEKKHYVGKTYCVTVPPYGLIFTRRNGYCFWSGNSGVDEIIFETARGAMSTVGAKTIMTGNPTRLSGYFFDAWHKNRQYWATMKVGSAESTRCNLKELERWKDEYGEDSNFYRVRALGEFPTAEDDVIIPLYMVESAVDRDVQQVESEEVWGLDVSRGGVDLCALAKRNGNRMDEPVKTWRSDDAMVSVGKVMQEYQNAKVKPASICVDSIGLGAPVADRLSEMGLPVTCVNVSESHSSNDRYLRLRDEMWERARGWFYARDCKITNDEAFIGEISLVKWQPTSNGKMKVVTKAEMKKDMGKSPDRSEAFCFTFMHSTGIQKKAKVIKYRNQGYA